MKLATLYKFNFIELQIKTFKMYVLINFTHCLTFFLAI